MDAVALANTRAQKLAVCREGEPVNRFPISDNAFWSWFSCLENQKNISFKQRFLLFPNIAKNQCGTYFVWPKASNPNAVVCTVYALPTVTLYSPELHTLFSILSFKVCKYE